MERLNKTFARNRLEVRKDRAAFAASGSLKKLAQLCILKNKLFFLQGFPSQDEDEQEDGDEEDKNPFDAISDLLKNELLELDLEVQDKMRQEYGEGDEIYVQWAMLYLLLNKEITSVHFPLDIDSDLKHSEVWKKLMVIRPPDLHTIVCKLGRSRGWYVRPFLRDSFLLRIFPSLEVLQLANLECNDQDLMVIAQNLKKLRILEIRCLREGVSKKGILALRKLKCLEEFLFGIRHRPSLDAPMLTECFELLCHLQAIAFKPMPRGYLSSLMNFFTGAALSKIMKPCCLQLRRLCINYMDEVPATVSLPELQALFLCNGLYEMHPLFAGGLSKLSELYMLETDEDTLLLVLAHVGQQLKALSFSILDCCGHYIENAVQLDRIINKCPNLSMLDVGTSMSPRCVSALQPDTLNHLQTLKLDFSDTDYLQTGLFLQILRLAPELQSINLSTVVLDNKDLKEWAKLAKKGTHMQHLQKVQMTIDNRHFYEDGVKKAKRLLNEVYISCSFYCPQLQEFSVTYYA